MKIEVLYVSDCPNHSTTVARVKQVLAAESVCEQVHEVLVTSDAEARDLQFVGSPSVRINGRDVEPIEQSATGLSCRIYADFSGVPSRESLRRAIAAAKESKSERR